MCSGQAVSGESFAPGGVQPAKPGDLWLPKGKDSALSVRAALGAGDVKSHSLMCPGTRALPSLLVNSFSFLAVDTGCLSAHPCRAGCIPVPVTGWAQMV